MEAAAPQLGTGCGLLGLSRSAARMILSNSADGRGLPCLQGIFLLKGRTRVSHISILITSHENLKSPIKLSCPFSLTNSALFFKLLSPR